MAKTKTKSPTKPPEPPTEPEQDIDDQLDGLLHDANGASDEHSFSSGDEPTDLVDDKPKPAPEPERPVEIFQLNLPLRDPAPDRYHPNQVHLSVEWNIQQQRGLHRLHAGLIEKHCKLDNGNSVNTVVDAIRWVCERAGTMNHGDWG